MSLFIDTNKMTIKWCNVTQMYALSLNISDQSTIKTIAGMIPLFILIKKNH